MEDITNIFVSIKPISLIAHAVGFSLGVGGATVNDFLFLRFLGDMKISKFESAVLNALSVVIWAGLAILIISGLGLYLADMETLNNSPKFLVKMIVVLIILINGIALNLVIAPKLRKISFEEKHEHVSGELRRLRKVAFALGAISIISWYSALILGSLRGLQYGFLEILMVYVAILALGVLGSQAAEYIISKKKIHL